MVPSLPLQLSEIDDIVAERGSMMSQVSEFFPFAVRQNEYLLANVSWIASNIWMQSIEGTGIGKRYFGGRAGGGDILSLSWTLALTVGGQQVAAATSD